MGSIFEEIASRRKLRDVEANYEDSVKDAQRVFDGQVEAIKGIKTTDGFREIIEYFEREAKACEVRLLNEEEGKDLTRIQVKYKVVKNFIEFLTSRLDYIPDETTFEDNVL